MGSVCRNGFQFRYANLCAFSYFYEVLRMVATCSGTSDFPLFVIISAVVMVEDTLFHILAPRLSVLGVGNIFICSIARGFAFPHFPAYLSTSLILPGRLWVYISSDFSQLYLFSL